MNYYGFYFGALGDKEQDSELEDLGLIYEDKEVESEEPTPENPDEPDSGEGG
jgi:hypothetical protein